MGNKILQLRQLGYTIEGRSVLDDVNLCIREGDHLAVCGPDGAGKSTLIQLMLNLRQFGYSPKTHKISGQITNTLFDRKTIGDVKVYLRNFNVLYDPYLKVDEILKLCFGNDMPTELLNQLELSDKLNQLVKRLPEDQVQKLNIILAIASEPKYLFLDEMTTGLDFDSRRTVIDYVKKYMSDHPITLVFATQYLEEAAELADHICILKEGRIVRQGNLEELYRQSGLKYQDIRRLYEKVVRYE